MKVIELSPIEALDLFTLLDRALESGARVRVAVDDGGFKIDSGTGWTAPMGTDTTARS